MGFLSGAALMLLPAMAQRQSADRMENADSTWAQKAAQGGMAEVKLGQLASSRGSSQLVKDFAQTMVDDHSKANDELKEIASRKGITLPSDLSAKDQTAYDGLSKLSGAEFDKAYIADMVRDHRAGVQEFRHESTNGTDPDLKAFASKTLPVIEHHLSMAEQDEIHSGK